MLLELTSSCSLALPFSSSATLQPLKFQPLPLGTVTPSGWLLAQLQLQADGLSGHLAQFWPDVSKSVWIGGSGDGGLHERTPYWLNGIVPLAFLLRNANHTPVTQHAGIWKVPSTDSAVFRNASLTSNAEVDCGMHLSAVVTPLMKTVVGSNNNEGAATMPVRAADLLSQVECYISYILEHQADDGWLGPRDDKERNAPWGRSNIMLALAQYAEAVPDKFDRVASSMLRYLLALRRRLTRVPLGGWAQQRWQDLALGVQWLLEKTFVDPGHRAELFDLLAMLQAQGSDWETWFESDLGRAGPKGANSHNVNAAQALKSAAVLYRQTGNASLRTLSVRRVARLDAHCGLPTGMYVGDELIPRSPTHDPSRGIELCGVVEAMFSFGVMFATFGRTADLDKIERIAFNALPATWASPRGGDMWAHQYLQAVNQIAARHSHPHVRQPTSIP